MNTLNFKCWVCGAEPGQMCFSGVLRRRVLPMPHRARVIGEEEAEVVSAITPPSF